LGIATRYSQHETWSGYGFTSVASTEASRTIIRSSLVEAAMKGSLHEVCTESWRPTYVPSMITLLV
jgi:hypothetical protein